MITSTGSLSKAGPPALFSPSSAMLRYGIVLSFGTGISTPQQTAATTLKHTLPFKRRHKELLMLMEAFR